jgi:peptidoglycan glycosyltransferase
MATYEQNKNDVVPEPEPPPRKPWRALTLVLFAVALLLGALYLAAEIPLRRARDAWRAERPAETLAILDRWHSIPIRPADREQLAAAALLDSGRSAEAQPLLRDLSGRGSNWLPILPKVEVARRFVAEGRYADFLAYDAASHEPHAAPDVELYRVAALAGSNQLAQADALFRHIDGSKVDAKAYAALQHALEQRRSGTIPLLLDRNGGTLATLQLANGSLAVVDRAFAPLIEKSAGALTIESQLQAIGTATDIQTTLDPDVQRAAVAAMGNYRGSLVAIDPRTNEILAIASTPGGGTASNLALESQYEPGSIIKTLTGLNAIDHGIDVDKMFPYECHGFLPIDGRRFGDWLPQGHGPLPSIDEAFAQSCNIVFGDLGLRLGADRLHAFMQSAGFDGQTSIGLYRVPLGRFGAPVRNNYDTASLAIGLEHESVNALHVAMLASMMANRGMLASPQLLHARHTILGEAVPIAPASAAVRITPAASAERMIRAMSATVNSSAGTGRHARVDGLTIAMKTGTAGTRNPGYQALILAFAPVENPRIAFGMIAENAGPAEIAGAKIAHDFLSAIAPRLTK